MSLQFNRILAAGNLTAAPAVRQIGKDKRSVCEFRIGCTRHWKAADGAKKQESTFFDCQAWGKTADFIAGHFGKGEGIFVEGFIQQKTWEKDNVKHSRLMLIVEEARFTDAPKPAAGGAK